MADNSVSKDSTPDEVTAHINELLTKASAESPLGDPRLLPPDVFARKSLITENIKTKDAGNDARQ